MSEIWYHADYMGHTEYVTDLAGSPYEYYFYMPFGEVAVAQHANNDGYSNPYRFASAEHDPETGFVLMGARYYDPKASIWISADPLSIFREWLTPYNYVRNNPIMFLDPSGLLDGRNNIGEIDDYPPCSAFEENSKQPFPGIGLYIVLFHLEMIPESSYSAGSDTRFTTKDGNITYFGKRHYNENDGLVFWVMSTEDNRVDFVVPQEDLKQFLENIVLYRNLAELTFANGMPDPNTLELISQLHVGNFEGALSAVGDMWGEDGVLFQVFMNSLGSFNFGNIARNSTRNQIRNTSNVTRSAARAGSKLTVQFGKGANQVSHVFRHTDALGLDRAVVKSAVENHFRGVSSQIVAGKPFNQIIEVAGQRIQYTAFKLKDGTINIGRIHGIN